MAQWYRSAPVRAMNKEMDWDTDDWRLALVTSSYTPNLDTDDYWNDVVANELATAGNYTANGFALTEVTPAYTAADSWGTARANSTAYVVGDVFRPAAANTWLYQVTVAGTSAAAPPTFPTVLGNTVADGTATIAAVGKGIIVVDANDVSQASFTAGPFRYAVIYDRTPGTDATRPLLGLIDFGSNQTGGGGTFNLTFHNPLGLLDLFMP